jgi:hypothetical protein
MLAVLAVLLLPLLRCALFHKQPLCEQGPALWQQLQRQQQAQLRQQGLPGLPLTRQGHTGRCSAARMGGGSSSSWL